MAELSWRDAIIKVMTTSADPMHYTRIAEAIAAHGLRTEIGATPAATVNSTISTSIVNEGEDSPFIRAGRGLYLLRHVESSATPTSSEPPAEDVEETGLINAFGMYWARSSVVWSTNPRILGQQQTVSTPVDFCNQRGVYLLHDGREVIYVGRAADQPLGVRLRQHTADRLNGRWDRFSWFGVYAVTDTGKIGESTSVNYTEEMLIVTMEALLIEGLEPRQNRKRGDDFRAVEFLQVIDPEIKKGQVYEVIDLLKEKLL